MFKRLRNKIEGKRDSKNLFWKSLVSVKDSVWKTSALAKDFVRKHRGLFLWPKFPYQVWIENTDYCNANCVICPRNTMTRGLGFMKFSLFEKLIKEISNHNVKRVHLHNFGEPLLDKDLPRRIKFAKDCGIKHTYIVTNASLLTPDLSRSLIESGLDEIKISFNGSDSETYEKTMRGLNFNTIIKNIKNFFEQRKKIGSNTPKVIIQYIPEKINNSKTKDFIRLFDSLIDKSIGDKLKIGKLHNYGGGKHYLALGKISRRCNFPWKIMVILHDGKVVPCCYDYNGTLIMGDVTKNTISQIWNSGAYTRMRKDFIKLKYNNYPICSSCKKNR